MQFDKEQIARFNLRLYQATSDQDLLLLRWWMDLSKSGELQEVFLPSNQTLGAFLSTFSPPTTTVLSLDDADKLRMVFWFSPFATTTPSTFISLWSAPAFRGKKLQIQLTNFVVEQAFAFWPVLRVITRAKHIALYQKAGYTVTGSFTGFYPDEPGWQMENTIESFKASKMYRLFNKEL